MGHLGPPENLAMCNPFRRTDYPPGHRDSNNGKSGNCTQLFYRVQPRRKVPDCLIITEAELVSYLFTYAYRNCRRFDAQAGGSEGPRGGQPLWRRDRRLRRYVAAKGGRISEKPRTLDEASQFLKKLSGSEFHFVTALAVVNSSSRKMLSTVETADIVFRQLLDREIQAYISPVSSGGSCSMGCRFAKLGRQTACC